MRCAKWRLARSDDVARLRVTCHGVKAGSLLVVVDARGQRIGLVDRGLECRRYLSVSGQGLDLGERGELLDSRAAAQGGLWFAGVAEAQLLESELLDTYTNASTLCIACHGVEAGPLLVVMDARGQRIGLVDRGLECRRYLSVLLCVCI